MLILLGLVIYGNSASAGTSSVRGVSAIAALDGRFGLLRTAAGAAPPAALGRAVSQAPASYGLDLAAARHASGANAWLVPGDGWLCIATSDSEGLGMSCTSAASAEEGQLSFSERTASSGEERIVGAVPDGYTTVGADAGGGDVASSPVRENTYTISARNVSRVTLGQAP